jgi:hypothetical protein
LSCHHFCFIIGRPRIKSRTWGLLPWQVFPCFFILYRQMSGSTLKHVTTPSFTILSNSPFTIILPFDAT